MLLRANEEVHGYDALVVDSNAPVANIRNVRVDGQAVDFAVEYAHKEGFRLNFELVHTDRAVLEFTYDLPIFRFGTTFSSRAYNSRFPTVPQIVAPGQVVDFGPADQDELSGLPVEIPKPQIGKLVGEIAIDARVFTPNGDGVNDQFEMFFNLLQLVEPARVALDVFDLAGWRGGGCTGCLRKSGGSGQRATVGMAGPRMGSCWCRGPMCGYCGCRQTHLRSDIWELWEWPTNACSTIKNERASAIDKIQRTDITACRAFG